MVGRQHVSARADHHGTVDPAAQSGKVRVGLRAQLRTAVTRFTELKNQLVAREAVLPGQAQALLRLDAVDGETRTWSGTQEQANRVVLRRSQYRVDIALQVFPHPASRRVDTNRVLVNIGWMFHISGLPELGQTFQMAPGRKHTSDAILDAVRSLLLDGGPRAATIAAIADASGAPPGTLNHRFGNREAILSATWLRAVERFHEHAFRALDSPGSPVETAVALALSVPEFARAHPGDARLLLSLRSADVLGADAATQLEEMNEPLFAAVRDLTRAVYGRADARSRDRITRAVVDLPYAAVRRHMPTLPSWLDEDLAEAVHKLLATR